MYCYGRLNSAADVEDLAQDILCEALKGLNRDAEISNFNAWYWKLAHNRFCQFLRMKKYRAASLGECGGSVASYTASFDSAAGERELSRMNHVLSRLSALHREVIIAFYLREESISEIARRLDVPEGTVKRRLHDAKTNARKGFEDMDNTGRSAYAPAELNLWGSNSAPDYWDKVSDILTKQIFIACRTQALSARQIADEIGVAPVYFEEKLKYLLENKLMKETSKGRYLTDFVILPEKDYSEYQYEHSRIFRDIGREVTEAVASVEDKIRALDFYGSSFSFDYLLWILYVYACTVLSDGMLGIYRGKWAGKVPGSNGKNYRFAGRVTFPDEKIVYRDIRSVSWSNLHKHFKTSDYSRVCHANLFEHAPFADRDFIITDENADLIMKLFDSPDYAITPNQEEQAASLIRKGYLRREGGGLCLTVPVMTWEQQKEIEGILATPLYPLTVKYVDEVSELSDRLLLPLIREDLTEEYVNWIMQGNFWPLGYVMHYGMNEGGTLALPEDCNSSAAGIALYYKK